MKRTCALISLGLLLLSSACKPEKGAKKQTEPAAATETSDSEATAVSDGHNSRLSLDWPGTYSGILPCADCDGVKTSLTLFDGGDFTRNLEFLGKGEGMVSDNGKFEWNAAGSVIILNPESPNPEMYQVGENVLFNLDAEGRRRSGTMASQYELVKNRTDTRLEDITWEVTELMGQKIELPEGTRVPHLKFNSALGQLTAHNGCNLMVATYRLREGNRLAFSQMASTLKACSHEAMASRFVDVLQTADNYTISDGILSLHKARTAPLARFRIRE